MFPKSSSISRLSPTEANRLLGKMTPLWNLEGIKQLVEMSGCDQWRFLNEAASPNLCLEQGTSLGTTRQAFRDCSALPFPGLPQ